ncbi:hypothetical protein [Streptomyces sp. NPDC005533]|uniref:hypothetical protein n=1 Tax=Streptomyces sp. NPDC005533 TaxID=3364723 RepID=UPI00368B0B9A
MFSAAAVRSWSAPTANSTRRPARRFCGALDHVTADERDLLVDLHGVTSLDADALSHLRDLHRRTERPLLRVLATG